MIARTLQLAAFLACVGIVLAAYPAHAEEFHGKVVGITDGDTLSVLREGRAVTVRLQGIDAPERRQPFGTRAKQYASSLAFGQVVAVHVKGRDRNARLLADVTLPDGRSLNHELVRAGFAWWFRRYSRDATLETLEAEARAAHRASGPTRTPCRRGSGGRPCVRALDVHLERSLAYDGPWLQLEGDTPEEWGILEQLAARGIRTNGPDVLAERLRLEALRETWTRTGRSGDG